MTPLAVVGVRAALAAAVASSVARAQLAPSPPAGSAGHCPVVGGITAAVTVRDSGRGAAPRDLVRVDSRASVDTTFTIDVT